MIHRAFVCLAVSTCLVACLGKTTSLGGPAGNQTSASSTDEDGGTDSGTRAPSVGASADPAAPSAPSASQGSCAWYVWAPVATTVACEYLLPSGAPPNNDPNFDPATWDPHNVRIEFAAKNIGEYAGTSAGCGTTDGWYYVEADGGQTPTRFMLCPASCARVASDGGYVRLAAKSCH